ncbi:putative ion channel [Alishewanella agri BL06]|uniref:Putative ion channel n=1 Tax=Alishewanella agri BL06 TaxID=1195246 RepID=I9NZ70_9ALTE|nr:potassium channel family protein [Alishewanella agri]EIW87739.1 putative ion channel [Alishewanella agri BL06]
MRFVSISIKALFCSYVACILVFAIFYYFLPHGQLNKDLTPVNALYFSVVTITTLGYGDIIPTSSVAQIAISFQALFGITILGLFINAIWTGHARKIESKTKEALKQQSILTNDRKLKSYGTTLSWIFSNLENSFFEVTTPATMREGKHWKFDEKYREKDLSGMFDISLKYRNGFNTSIECFYANEDAFVTELKFLLSNFELDHHPELQKDIITYIGHYHSDQSRGALLLYAQGGHEGKGAMIMKAAFANHEDGEHFKEGFTKSELHPALIFSLTLNTKYNLVVGIDSALQKICV